MKQDLFLFLKN